MTITKITPSTPTCMGICCPRHGACARYLEIDGSSPDDHRIATCAEGEERPMFVMRLVVDEVQAA